MQTVPLSYVSSPAEILKTSLLEPNDINLILLMFENVNNSESNFLYSSRKIIDNFAPTQQNK